MFFLGPDGPPGAEGGEDSETNDGDEVDPSSPTLDRERSLRTLRQNSEAKSKAKSYDESDTPGKTSEPEPAKR